MTQPVAAALAGLSTLFGFTILGPLMPVEFVGFVTAAAGNGSLMAPGLIGMLGEIALALAIGRVFCAHVCPVGAVQELSYIVLVKKHIIASPKRLEVVRAGLFVLSVASDLVLVNLMAYTGVYAFFSLTASIGFAVCVGLVTLSAVVYRPICRVLCPFELFFSLPAHISRLHLRRSAACIDCCRCVDACRVKGAIEYRPGRG